ncbi:MAG TPA: HesA/MoeB/ThiF family protein [Sphingobacterium sp.]|jgi:molybdopterin/thiamine biosynthesis adenylyltransferase|nr:HesA/MoeB/ThiF family protein [Sphingobacterium sp.]
MNSRFFSDHLQLPFIGKQGIEKLKCARVLVVGAGGLGCPVVSALASSGIGYIGILDGDRVELKNLARQYLYTPEQVGELKTTAAVTHLSVRYQDTIFKEHSFFVDEANIHSVFSAYDIIIDATDNFPSRLLIGHTGIQLNIPVVYGSIFRSEVQITVFNYEAQRLAIDDLFTLQPATAGMGCEVSGTYVIGSMVAGMLMANEVIKVLLDLPDKLMGKLLLFDVLSLQKRIINFSSLRSRPAETILEMKI